MTLLDQIAADVPSFLDATSGFASAATLTNPAASAKSVNVQYLQPYAITDEFGQKVANSSPAALIADTDAVGCKQGSTLRIGTTTWQVVGVEPNSTGITRLVLSTTAQHGAQ